MNRLWRLLTPMAPWGFDRELSRVEFMLRYPSRISRKIIEVARNEFVADLEARGGEVRYYSP